LSISENLKSIWEQHDSGFSEIIRTQKDNMDSEEYNLSVFDRIVMASGLFKAYSEVDGFFLHPRPNTQANFGRQPRIDRILVPSQKLFSAGWTNGVIGVEGKSKHAKAGHAICQCLDYARAAFNIKGGILVVPSWIFLFPAEHDGCDIGSIMTQNRIGVARYRRYECRDEIELRTCGRTFLSFDDKGVVAINNITTGAKVGSR